MSYASKDKLRNYLSKSFNFGRLTKEQPPQLLEQVSGQSKIFKQNHVEVLPSAGNHSASNLGKKNV